MITQVSKAVERARDLLLEGEIVAIPTETVYGLAGNGLDDHVVAKIFATKERPSFNPLILHFPSLERILEMVTPPPLLALNLAEAFWPGPLTLLLEKQGISDLVTAGSSLVAVRVPYHPMTQELLASLPFPLAAPSANRFGQISPTSPDHVIQGLGGRIPLCLDGGPCPIGLESTIIGFEGEMPFIYRYGGISKESIEKVTGLPLQPASSSPLLHAPGRTKQHYAPLTPLKVGNLDQLLEEHQGKRVAILSLQREFLEENSVTLSLKGDLEEAAARFFAALHTLDQRGVALILAEWMPEEGLGRAINDRLRRAALASL